MSKRINVMIDDDTWGILGRAPAGERSRAINDALRAWVTRRRRRDAVREMDVLREQLPKVGTDEVARWIREDRDQGHCWQRHWWCRMHRCCPSGCCPRTRSRIPIKRCS